MNGIAGQNARRIVMLTIHAGIAARMAKWSSCIASGVFLFALAAALPSSLCAQEFPARPIKLVIPLAAGSSTDLLARDLTGRAKELLGYTFVIENRPGASGAIASSTVARAEPDGYTLLLGNNSTHGSNISLHKSLPYDPVADFVPVARIASQPLVVAVHPSVQAKTFREFVDFAKARPGELNFASLSVGSSAHLAGETLNIIAGIKLVHVPYNSAQAFSDFLAGRVSVMFYPYQPLKGYVESNQLRAIATTGEKRDPWLPNTPTAMEAGYTDFVFRSWFAVFAPRGTPQVIVQKLQEGLEKVVRDPQFIQTVEKSGSLAWFAGAEELKQFTSSEIERYRKVVAASGARAD